jgi:hypothetical protein
MHALRGVFFAICACGLMSACASAPMSLAASHFGAGEITYTTEQTALRTRVDALELAYEGHGWSERGDMMVAARGWMGRLAGQYAPGQEEDDAALPTYLVESSLLELDGVTAAARLAADMTSASDLARDVEVSAQALIGADTIYSRLTLTRDLDQVERSITHTRQALDTFQDAMNRVDANLSDADRERLQRIYAEFFDHADRLSDRADDIAALRRNPHSALVS